MSTFTEDSYEQALLSLFEGLGYTRMHGRDVVRDEHEPCYVEELEKALARINPKVPIEALKEAKKLITQITDGSLVQRNEVFTEMLQDGVAVRIHNASGGEKNYLVRLVDYDNVDNNSFVVANQWTVEEYKRKRMDIVLLLNGMPVVVLELKSPSREETDASEAYVQLKNYMQDVPSLFVYNQVAVMSDMAINKAGSITANEDRYLDWKSKDGTYESTEFADYDTMMEGMFAKERLLDIIKNFTCFSHEEKSNVKILAAYHQYWAVRKAVEKARMAVESNGKIGVFWHTQGSGKSLSMVFFAHLVEKEINNPTIVVITDRNDLDNQLFTQFSKCQKFLRQTPVQASSKENLRELLLEKKVGGGIIFTTMQKFEARFDEKGNYRAESLSDRRNIIVMTDEAHRGQYGFEAKVDAETGRVSIGAARVIHDSLPNASYIGFTGTPISTSDKDTREVFGDDIDVYDMTQSVADGATRPIYYESRVVKLRLDDDTLALLDKEYDKLAEEGANDDELNRSKHDMAHTEAILGHETAINSLCDDIVFHYEDSRQYELTGKAMIVAYNRDIAYSIYKRILELRPQWDEKVKLVVTESNKDTNPELHRLAGSKAYRQQLGRKFKDDNDEMKIAIVVDMWLTGFDVPSLATMYVYKPMKGYSLMQAIARVNRVYPGKEGGLIVDYVGLFHALQEAMHDYTKRDQTRYSNNDIGKTALKNFKEKVEVCRGYMPIYDKDVFWKGSDSDRTQLIKKGVNVLMSPQKQKEQKEYLFNANKMHGFLTLCRSLVCEELRWEAAFYDTVRILLLRLTGKGRITKTEINERIRELLKQSVHSEGVTSIFKDNGEVMSLFNKAFLKELKEMKEKNIAQRVLEDLLRRQLSVLKTKNVVQSEAFSELLTKTLNAYINGLISNQEVIEQLLKMAEEMKAAEDLGKELGLTQEEKAFYDALTKPEAIKDFYSNEQLIGLTKELTEALRANKSLDWRKKVDARASMRKMIKRLLKKYNYPPEKNAEAMETVLKQCEAWADDEDNYAESAYTKPRMSYTLPKEDSNIGMAAEKEPS